MFFYSICISPSPSSASRSEWNLTFDFMELYNSKDLVVYFTVREIFDLAKTVSSLKKYFEK